MRETDRQQRRPGRLTILACTALLWPALAAAQSPAPKPPPAELSGAEELSPFANAFGAETVLLGHGLRGFSPVIAGNLLRADDGGPIALATLALPRQGGRVSVWVEIDGPTFLAGNIEGRRLRGEIYVYALTPSGGVAGHFAEAFAVDLDRIGEAVWQSGLKLRGELTLPPGEYRLRVLVRNRATEALGLLSRALTVPAADAPAPVAMTWPTPPDRDAWIPIRSWSLRQGGEAPAKTDDLNPSALPVLAADESAAARLQGAADLAPGMSLGLRLVAVDTPQDEPALGQAELAEEGRVAFTVPAVETGVYRIALSLGEGGPWTPEVPVLVLADAERERSLQWTDLRWRMQESLDPTAGGPSRLAAGGESPGERRSGRRRDRRQARQIAERYRQALGALAEGSDGSSGDFQAALQALFEFESSALGGGVGLLSSGESLAAEKLAEEEPAILLPLIVLHQRLYRRYQGRRAYSLGSHSRLMVEMLTERYLAAGGEASVAADSLAALGGVLIDVHLPSSGSRLLQRARELEPGHPVALLGLAALFERFGSYGQARSLLLELVESHPQHREGRLRLAVNLLRTGDRSRAAELLAAIDGRTEESWIWSLARQEQTRLLLSQNRVGDALAVLTAAHAEAPRDAALALLLAHVHDRLGNAAEAQALVAGVQPSNRKESPRMRYDRPPREAFAGADQALAAAARNAQPLLLAALDDGQGAR
ncbi:MAG: tetratricopeptide repeat protein [Acidobacteriota bacterium]